MIKNLGLSRKGDINARESLEKMERLDESRFSSKNLIIEEENKNLGIQESSFMEGNSEVINIFKFF